MSLPRASAPGRSRCSSTARRRCPSSSLPRGSRRTTLLTSRSPPSARPAAPSARPPPSRCTARGFADLGAGQLACMVDGVRAADGLLLDSGRVLCELPAATAAGAASVTISLNNGDAGTLTNALPFTRYEPPEVLGVTPDAGDANGGALVTVFGRGFTALEPGTARAAVASLPLRRDRAAGAAVVPQRDGGGVQRHVGRGRRSSASPSTASTLPSVLPPPTRLSGSTGRRSSRPTSLLPRPRSSSALARSRPIAAG